MKRWEQFAEAEVKERTSDFLESVRSNTYTQWRHFAEDKDCSGIACRFCPFDNSLCDMDDKKKMHEILNEEAGEEDFEEKMGNEEMGNSSDAG